jgi:hypothetical protein
MQLNPTRHPGRSDRKAAAYASEIVRLRAAGYTFESIRQALAEVGLELHTSVLRREVRRPQKRAKHATQTRSAPAEPQVARELPAPSVPRMSSRPRTKGQELAEAFFNANPGNPLLRSKEAP